MNHCLDFVRSRQARMDKATATIDEARSVSGGFEYSGALLRNGRYQVNAHSGDVRFTLGDNTGFELSATTFSGEIRSAMPLTIGGRAGGGDTVIVRGRAAAPGKASTPRSATEARAWSSARSAGIL